jgi:integrase
VEVVRVQCISLEAADILKLEPLTGARCGEISGLRAEEIDRNKWVWTLPASRSKNGRQRVTPIVGLAREMLDQRLSRIETGPLFLLEKGVVVTSAHIGQTRRTALPIAVFTSQIFDELSRRC